MTALGDRVERLNRSVERLTREVGAVRTLVAQAATAEMRQALRRRGLRWTKTLHDGCLAPSAPAAQAEFYRLLRHYSFRLFLRDVIKHRERFTAADLVRYCSRASADRYLQWLQAHRMVRRARGALRLSVPATSFGPTLEWFVALVLQREYGIPSVWNVRLDGAPGGGDYDVVGLQEGTCVYVEVKSSPPRNIEVRQVRAFLDRVETLRPHLAIFLNDTQLRMGDKIAVLFGDELRRRRGRHSRAHAMRRLAGEVFAADARLFIANSEPDLVSNIGICLAHYFRHQGFHLDGGA